MTPFFYVFRIPRRRSHKKRTHHIICVILFCNFFALPRPSFLLSALKSLRLIHPKCRNDQERASGVLFSSVLSSTLNELSRQSGDLFCFATLLFAIFSRHNLTYLYIPSSLWNHYQELLSLLLLFSVSFARPSWSRFARRVLRSCFQSLLIDKDGVMLPSLGHPNDVTMMTIQDYQNRVKSVGNAWPLLFSTRTKLAPFFLEKLFIPLHLCKRSCESYIITCLCICWKT